MFFFPGEDASFRHHRRNQSSTSTSSNIMTAAWKENQNHTTTSGSCQQSHKPIIERPKMSVGKLSRGGRTKIWKSQMIMIISCLFYLLLGSTIVSSSSLNIDTTSMSPTLPFGDINVMVLTDVHSWLGGHGKVEPYDNVDYGHVLSFYERLKAHCDAHDMDLWFVMNGDWIDGTGLSLNGDPSYLIPLLQKMPWDAVNVGNHELYKSSVIEYVTRPGGFIDWWGDRYLSSNIYRNDQHKQPLGNQYTVLRGRNADVLVFGFIYNLSDPSDLVTVQSVESAVKEKWFRSALTTESYDAILVLAHMGHDDHLVQVLIKAIRSHLNDDNMPVQFLTGHTHRRGFATVDDWSTSVEAGRYLDTVGFVSFPMAGGRRILQQTNGTDADMELDDEDTNVNGTDVIGDGDNDGDNEDPIPGDGDNDGIPGDNEDPIPGDDNNSDNSTIDNDGDNPFEEEYESGNDAFRYVFLDANQDVLKQALGVDALDTKNGAELRTFIQHTRGSLGLTKPIGCVPENFYYNRSLFEKDSLWALYVHQVVPTQLIRDDPSKVMFISQESWRYNLLKGENTLDDVIAVSPFNDTIYYVGEIPGSVMLQLNKTINGGDDQGYLEALPFFVLAGSVFEDSPTKLYTHGYEMDRVLTSLKSFYDFDGEPELYEELTSTSIWINYVQNELPCSGGGIKIPPWLGGGNEKFFDDSDGSNNYQVAIVLSVLAFVFVSMILCIRWMLRKSYYGIDHSATHRLAVFGEEDEDEEEEEEVDLDRNGNELL